jgi:uncharacterized protein YxjI
MTPFSHQSYILRKKVFKLFGGAFHIFAPNGALAFYSSQKAFKLKEDIRVYSDESMGQELLVMKARNVLDISATYDVTDPALGARVGALRRKGLKSILKDEWLILDDKDREIGLIQEDSTALALLRRFAVGWLLPQTYQGAVGGQAVCEFKRNFNPFVSKVSLDFSMDSAGRLDRRLGIAAAVLLLAIEGKQN